MFSERLSGLYTGLEEKYYAALDFLDARGLPVYSYNDFLDEKGLPAFPITIALIVLLLAGIYGLVFVGNTVNSEITISFSDQFEDSVSGVTLSVKDSFGNTVLQPKKISNNESLMLPAIPLGTELTLVAEKAGFKKAEQKLPVTKQKISTAITLEREIIPIEAEMQLLDQSTKDPIRNAIVNLDWRNITKTGTSNAEGKVSFAGIPQDIDVLITIQADGYESLSGNYSFRDQELETLDLVASSLTLSGNASLVVSVEDSEGNPVEGAKIIIMDRVSDTSIEERTIDESEAVFSISKGTSVRLIVQKDGFLRYDSMDLDEGRTLRQDEEQWPVVLNVGGTRLVVSVFVGQTPLSDATVTLFDLEGSLVEESVSGFGGTASFSNLNPEEYYVTAWKQGFLPAR